jgi:hypothetical protein
VWGRWLLREGKLVTSCGLVLQKLFYYFMLVHQQTNIKEPLANGENRRLFDILTMTVQSLVRFYAKETDTLYLPTLERTETEKI